MQPQFYLCLRFLVNLWHKELYFIEIMKKLKTQEGKETEDFTNILNSVFDSLNRKYAAEGI